MNKLIRWMKTDVKETRFDSLVTMGIILVLLAIVISQFISSSNKYDNLAKEYAAELEAQNHHQDIFQYYHKLSPAMRAYLYDLQNYRSSARVQYIQYFGWKDRDVLIGIEHNVVNDTYYGIWGINGSPDYNLERGEAWNQDVFIHVE